MAEGEGPVAEPIYGPSGTPIEVVPVVVLSQVFPARPSSIPDIRDFVRRCLAESPLTDEGTREVGETVFRALLDAAGPTGSIQVAFRIFPEHVEVDVLHSDTTIQSPVMPGPPAPTPFPRWPACRLRPVARAVRRAAGRQPSPADRRPVRPTRSGRTQPGRAGGPRPARPARHIRRVDVHRAAAEGPDPGSGGTPAGVPVKTVSRWVGGATEPRMRDLRRIQEVFGEVPLP